METRLKAQENIDDKTDKIVGEEAGHLGIRDTEMSTVTQSGNTEASGAAAIVKARHRTFRNTVHRDSCTDVNNTYQISSVRKS